MKSKLYIFISAVGVMTAAFFELCFTGRAVCSWRLARADTNRLSLRAVGVKVTPAEYPDPRPGNLVFRRRVGATFPPASIPQLSRKVGIGMYSAMLFFLVFCFTVFVTCPSGRSFAMEDGSGWTVKKMAIASGTGTEAQSSTPVGVKRFAIAGCVIASIMTIGVVYINASRKESNYGKKRTETNRR